MEGEEFDGKMVSGEASEDEDNEEDKVFQDK